jgi:hypothetical protein
MNSAHDLRQPRRGGRSSDGRVASTVSVLRWPFGRSASGVFEMFSAREEGWFGAFDPESADSAYGENVLFVSASRKGATNTPAVLLSLVNASPCQAVRLSVKLAGRMPTSVAGTVLTAPPMTPNKEVAQRGSGASNAVQPGAFRGAVLKGKVVEITVPARSVVVVTVLQPRSAPRRSTSDVQGSSNAIRCDDAAGNPGSGAGAGRGPGEDRSTSGRARREAGRRRAHQGPWRFP